MAIASCLVDTNILLRMTRRSDPQHQIVDTALARLASQGIILHYTHQNIAELWNVMTRPPVRNGLGLTVAEAERQVRAIESGMSFLPDSEAVYREWRRIVVQWCVGCSGARCAIGCRHARAPCKAYTHVECGRFQPLQRSHRRASRQHPLATPSFTASSFLETAGGGLPQLCGRKRLQKCINLGGEDAIAQLFRLVFQG